MTSHCITNTVVPPAPANSNPTKVPYRIREQNMHSCLAAEQRAPWPGNAQTVNRQTLYSLLQIISSSSANCSATPNTHTTPVNMSSLAQANTRKSSICHDIGAALAQVPVYRINQKTT